MDREKAIKDFEYLLNAARGNYQDFVDLTVDSGEEILALLKEQEAEIEQLNMFVNGFSRDAMPVVRCKDCKHRPIMPKDHTDGFDLKFPDNKCPCQCEDGWYSWCPEDNWFCADGELKQQK